MLDRMVKTDTQADVRVKLIGCSALAVKSVKPLDLSMKPSVTIMALIMIRGKQGHHHRNLPLLTAVSKRILRIKKDGESL